MLRGTFLLTASTLLCGCGAGDGGPVSVSGTVKYADGTVPKGESSLVWFEPVSDGKAANGTIAEDGSFTLFTKTPGDGVAQGEYKVVLKIWKSYREQTLAVPEQYGDAAKTPLEATVSPDNTHFDFTVEK